MIGRMVGKNALGAAGLANSLAFLFASIAIGGLPVVGPLIAKSKASKNLAETKATYLATLRVALIFCLLIGLISLFLYLNFDLLRQTQEINAIAKEFFLILIGSSLPLFFFTAYKQLSDGLSLPRVAMYITFIGLLVNIGLNWILIRKMGIQGAAWSTFAVRLVMTIIMAIYIYKSKKFQEVNVMMADPSRISALTRRILQLSIPGGLQFFFEIGAFSFAVVMMGWISEDALAAHQIAINIAAVTYMMASGIGYASGIRVGAALGKKSAYQVKLAANSGFILVFLFMSLAALLIYLFRIPLVQLYIRNEEIEQLAVSLLLIAALFQLSDGIQVVALGVLRGISDVNIPAVITFVAYWVISLPLGYFLAFKFNLGADGVWLGLLGGLSFAALLSTIRFYRLYQIKERYKLK